MNATMNPVMRFPETTPLMFSGAKTFVEKNGMEVWWELCDEAPIGQWIRIDEVAKRLPRLQGYKHPERYLKAVLLAIREDMKERPDEYEVKSFTWREGLPFNEIML